MITHPWDSDRNTCYIRSIREFSDSCILYLWKVSYIPSINLGLIILLQTFKKVLTDLKKKKDFIDLESWSSNLFIKFIFLRRTPKFSSLNEFFTVCKIQMKCSIFFVCEGKPTWDQNNKDGDINALNLWNSNRNRCDKKF